MTYKIVGEWLLIEAQRTQRLLHHPVRVMANEAGNLGVTEVAQGRLEVSLNPITISFKQLVLSCLVQGS